MTYPRAHLVDAENGGFYHCISRCVRQGWLCGNDPLSGRCFEHRRAWIETRLSELAGIFAIDLYAYAVLSNHYHLVVEVVPGRVDAWSDSQVAMRWCALTPRLTDEEREIRVAALLRNTERLAEIRTRLGSLSWFMRYLNESIARRANREDERHGRFWEGRFRSIALLDDAAVAACMVYVDLNPIRAKMAERVEDSAHTSIARRLEVPEEDDPTLAPLRALGLTLPGYRSLLEWTVAIDRGSVSMPESDAARALARLGQGADGWLGRVRVHRLKFRAYGALRLLEQYAAALGQHWLCGAKPGFAAPS